MNILKDVLSELLSMFVADARLTTAILTTVAAAALLIAVPGVPPLAGGAVLLLGSVAVLFRSVGREAARRRLEHGPEPRPGSLAR